MRLTPHAKYKKLLARLAKHHGISEKEVIMEAVAEKAAADLNI